MPNNLKIEIMKNENNHDPKEKITNNPDPKEKGTNNDPEKNDKGNNPKLPGTDPDQTPEKEIQEPPVADPNKDKDGPDKKEIGFNK